MQYQLPHLLVDFADLEERVNSAEIKVTDHGAKYESQIRLFFNCKRANNIKGNMIEKNMH